MARSKKRVECRHLWIKLVDEFGDPAGFECSLCPAWATAPDDNDRVSDEIKTRRRW